MFETLSALPADAILKLISQSSYASYFAAIPNDATLQFVCKNHEVKRRNPIYRQMNVHKF